ncbi:Immunoglobulin E-set [Pseudocohnilembus persalinus]|uniref:Immunoglobulin E-set n=1 Tax=Pseudocohnilembus persalinus TaxID=266149 RepID=A0A0V0QYW7_PSEPJ|nr:Immunoglobulin E-set [Pseudocohnilembus persalinus]|eukprot:KRX07519.1 Immunoglobulin E-set [Pseudocohnilembus persalinus]
MQNQVIDSDIGQRHQEEKEFQVKSIKMSNFENGEVFWEQSLDQIFLKNNQNKHKNKIKNEDDKQQNTDKGDKNDQNNENKSEETEPIQQNKEENIDLEAYLPEKILQCKNVGREIIFYSKNKLKKLRLEQKVYLRDQIVEFFQFDFGFVIPGSTNNWQQVLETDQDNMLPKAVLSGNLVVQNCFYDGDRLLSVTNVKIFYE